MSRRLHWFPCWFPCCTPHYIDPSSVGRAKPHPINRLLHGATPVTSSSRFTGLVLKELRVLERMLGSGMIEAEGHRIGAEQEVVLVDRSRRPVLLAREVLAELDDERFTHELALFNVELNLQPLPLGPSVLSDLQTQLEAMLERLYAAAHKHGADVALTGILPCLRRVDLGAAAMTPLERYRRLNEATMALAQGRVLLHIVGADELRMAHDSVMLEACNTSFQVHLQVAADEFPRLYNAAQLALGPLLAVACNSPFLFGKRLWAETRVAVFQQSIDTRTASPPLRDLVPRVRFGERWVKDSAVELFEQDISRFRPILVRDPEEDAEAVLNAGGVPRLGSLQFHNSTVYRWNRPCYGVTDGKPHLRIECRAIPAGPTPLDEVANAAFWLGMVAGLAGRYGNVAEHFAIEDAKTNFLAAARRGLHCGFTWFGGVTVDARTLVLQLVDLAAEGLARIGVDETDARRYLDVIAGRVRTGQTGAMWLERSAAAMKGSTISRPERCAALTSAMITRQREGAPVHEWPLATIADGRGNTAPTVAEYMTTDLFTIQATESVELVAFVMDREGFRHMLVEDERFQLVGVISYRSLLRLMARGHRDLGEISAAEVMVADPVTVPPDAPVAVAGRLMQEHAIACLPVVEAGKLVGVVTERDFMPLAAELLHRLFGDS